MNKQEMIEKVMLLLIHGAFSILPSQRTNKRFLLRKNLKYRNKRETKRITGCLI